VTKRSLLLTGELSLTAAALILLYVVYQVWFTNVVADSTSNAVAAEVSQTIELANAKESTADAEVYGLAPEPEVGFALVYIPRLKSDVWGIPLVEGTSHKALASGIGHYSNTELPGEVGNFAIAGHRATNGEPFARFERLTAGDLVYIHSTAGWFVYELVADQKIPNTALWVLDDVPSGLEIESNQLITLTTCDPRWNSTQRWAWWGKLISDGPDAPKELAH
jgi:sortase A